MKKLQEKIRLMEGYLNAIDEILNELDIETEAKIEEEMHLPLFSKESIQLSDWCNKSILASIDFINEVILPIAEIIDEVKIQAGIETIDEPIEEEVEEETIEETINIVSIEEPAEVMTITKGENIFKDITDDRLQQTIFEMMNEDYGETVYLGDEEVYGLVHENVYKYVKYDEEYYAVQDKFNKIYYRPKDIFEIYFLIVDDKIHAWE